MSGGRNKWIPRRTLKQLENIKTNYQIKSDARAFDKMAELAPVGMEFEKMRDRFMMRDIFGNVKKKKRR